MRAAPDKKSWIIGLVLALAVIAVYWPVRHFEFLIYDDTIYVSMNPHVQQGLNWATFGWAFHTTDCSNWHPLTWLTHLFDWQMFKSDAGKHHLTNLFFHAASSVLLFFVWRRMTGAVWRSAFLAALFALHPLRVESVAWVSERKDVLSTFFFMLTLWAYACFAKKSEVPVVEIKTGKKKPSARQKANQATPKTEAVLPPVALHPLSSPSYYLCLLFFILGLMSKPMLVTVPFVLLLLDYWPLGRVRVKSESGNTPHSPPSLSLFSLVLEKIPFFVLTVVGCIVTVWSQKTGGAVTSLAQLPWGARISNAFLSYIHYLKTFFYTVDLAAPYPHPGFSPWWVTTLAAVFLLGVTVGAWFVRSRQPWFLSGWLWFLGMMVPVIGLLQVGAQAYADRYTYISMIGFTAALIWTVADLAGQGTGRFIAGALGVGSLIICIVLTSKQVEIWRNTETLFTHAIAVTKDNALAHNNLGAYLLEHQRYDEAIEHCEEALRIVPTYPDPHATLAFAYTQSGHLPEAAKEYPLALKYDPDNANLHNGYGSVLAQLKRFSEASEEFGAAARHSTWPEAPANWALACVQSGKFEEAITHYQEAIRMRPSFSSAYSGMGTAWVRLNKPDEAIKSFQECLRLAPNDFNTVSKLGDIYLQTGHASEAVSLFREAVRAQPQNYQWHFDLGASLASAGKNGEALAEFQEALRLNPDSADTKAAIARLSAKPSPLLPAQSP